MITELERECLQRFCMLLSSRLGERLVEVRMFGSAARGDMWPSHSAMHSDIDLLVVTRDPVSERVQEELLNETYPLSLHCGRQLSPHFFPERRLREPEEERTRELLRLVDVDGVLVWRGPTRDPDESLEIVDPHGRPLGVKARAAVHRDGDLHVTFHCWIAGRGQEGAAGHLLLQRRGMHKDVNPGRLDVSVAGHLAAGESVRDGLRELEEEVGLADVAFEQLVALGRTREDVLAAGIVDRELCETFLLRRDDPLEDFRPPADEVAALLALPLAAAHELFAGEREDVACRALVPGRGVERQRVRRADFVARPHTYYAAVSDRAEALLDGQPVPPLAV